MVRTASTDITEGGIQDTQRLTCCSGFTDKRSLPGPCAVRCLHLVAGGIWQVLTAAAVTLRR